MKFLKIYTTPFLSDNIYFERANGYARTEAPADIEAYTFKSTSADLAQIARKFVGLDGHIVLGGHDWE